MEIPIQKIDKWIWTYFKCMYIFSRTYDPKNEMEQKAMKCFVQNIINLVPNTYIKSKMTEYVYMTPNVKSLLLNNYDLQNFFRIYINVYDMIKASDSRLQTVDFLDYCVKNNFTMTIWIYLLHCYIIILQNKSGNFIQIPTFKSIRDMYDPDILTKDEWGNSVWFIIHVSALYSTGDMKTIFYNYKAMLSCLQYILPCPKCKAHLIDNLTLIDIDECSNSKEDLFRCSWKLHNIVNKSLNKYQPSLEEAIRYYQF